MPPFKFTDTSEPAPATRSSFKFTDTSEPATPPRPSFKFTDTSEPVAPEPAFRPTPAPAFKPPAAPQPIGERVRERFIGERAASNIGGLDDVLDPTRRAALVNEATDTARAEGIGREMYPGGSIKAGVSTPARPLGRETPGSIDTPEARFALDKFRKEREVASRGGDPDDAFAVPRTLPGGRRLVGEPSVMERVGQVAGLPVTAPLGIASELYRQIKQTVTGEPQAEGFLPSGDDYGTNIGRNVAALPAALGNVAMRKSEEAYKAIDEKGFNRALYEGLGLDRDPVSMPGEASAAKGEGWSESILRGLKRIPSEIGDIATGFTQLGVAGAEALGSLGTPEGNIENVVKQGVEGVKEVGTGAFRSFARTALDPRAEFERGPIGTALNAAMSGQGVRKLTEPLTDASAARTAKMTRELDGLRAETAPAALTRQSLYFDADEAARASARTKDALDAMDARIDVAERAGNAIDDSAYVERADLGKRFAAQEARVRETRRAVEVFDGPSAKTDAAAEGWARAVKAGTNAERGMAEAVAKLEELGVPGRALNEGIAKTMGLERRLSTEAAKRAVAETAARVPSYVATLGLTGATDLLSHGIKRLGVKFPELRWWLNPRNEQVGEIVGALEREGMGRKTKREQQLSEALANVPDEARPTVRRFLQAEHSPLEGGYWMPGNDRSRQMFEFKSWDQSGKPARPGGKARQQSAFTRTEYGEMMRAKKLAEAKALREMAGDLEQGAPAVKAFDNLADSALDVARAEAAARLDDINARIDQSVGARAERGAAAVSKAEDATIRAQGADFALGAAKVREAELAQGLGGRADNRPMGADAFQAEQARILDLSASLRATREAATKQAKAEVRQGLSAQAGEAIGGALDARTAKVGEMKGVFADALKIAREEAQAAINATPRGGKTATRETWDKAIGAERRAEDLKQARTQGAEDLRTQLSIKAARAAESRAWAAWQDSLTRSERAQAAADGAKLRGEVADLKATQAAKQAAATAWDNARRSTYRAEVAARSRLEDLARIEEAANAAIRRETGLGPSDAMRMGASVPRLPRGAEGPMMPRSQSAGPVLDRNASQSRESLVGMMEESALLSAKVRELDALADLRRQGRTVPNATDLAAMAADFRRQSIGADEWVAKMDGEQRVVNRYGRGLAELSRAATEDAKALGMFENAEQIRQLYWPQVMDRAIRDGTIADPLQAMGKSDRKKLNPYLEGSRLRANALRREGVPMTRREAEYGLSTDLAEEAMAGLMGFIDDVETYKLYDRIDKSGVPLDEAAFLQKRALAVAEHNARVSAKYRGNPAKIAAEAIDPVNPRGDIPGMDDWIMVPDEARFPENVRKAAGMTDDAGSPGLKKYGALGGKYIPADLFFDMVNKRAALEEASSAISQMNRRWKSAKTVWSPATHARNVLSSALVFAPMVGMSLWNPRNLGYYSDALSDLARGKKSDVYRMAERDGVFQGTFGRSELGRDYLASQLEGAFQNTTEPMARLFEMVGEAGQAAKGAVDDIKSGAFQRERQTRAKLRDVEGQDQWVRMRQGAPEPKSFAPSRRAWAAAKASGSALTRLPGMVYGAQDDLFRLAYYRKMIDQAARAEGVSPTLVSQEARSSAAMKAREAFIDYENVPGFAQVLRSPMAPVTREGKSRAGGRAAFYLAGQPFVAFSARAIPRMQRWLAEDPLRAQLWMQTSDYLSDVNLARSGMTSEEVEAAKGGVRGTSPSSMTAMGEIVPGMGKDAEGRIELLNTGYLSPVSQYSGGKTTRYDSDSAQLWDFMGEVLNIDINPLVRPAAEQLGIVPTFTGQPLVRRGMTSEEETAARLSHLIQSYLPPITPSLSDMAGEGSIGSGPMDRTRIKGGSQYERIAASAAGVPDYQGRERPLSGAVRDVFLGTRGQSVDIDDALVNQTEQVEGKRRDVARSAQEATGILVPMSQMRPPQLRAFATEYRKRLTPLLAVYAEAVEPYPPSRLVRGIKKNLDLLERGTMNDIRWMATADKLFDDALREGIQNRTKAKAARTKAAQERN